MKPQTKKVDVIATTQELAEMMREEPSSIERDLIQQGSEILGIFSDETMRGTFKDFNKMKIQAICLAVEDLSSGANTLRRSSIGLSYRNNKFVTFIEPFGSQPSGNVVFSINLKETAAFKNWRNEDGSELSQENLNIAIYRLAVLWSQLLA